MKNNFPSNLKELREQNNLSQKELASYIGINRSTLSYYESGQSEPTLTNLIKLSNYFDCSIDSLVFGLNNQENLNSNKYNTYTIKLNNIISQLENLNIQKLISNIKDIKSDFDKTDI